MDIKKCSKIGHHTEEAANNIITKAWAGHKSWQGKTLPIRAYKCWCKKWHLTSKPLMTQTELVNKAKDKAGALWVM